MPAFTFEKISPPVRRGPGTTAPQKPRSVISKMLDRLAEKRAKRGPSDERGVPAREQRLSE